MLRNLTLVRLFYGTRSRSAYENLRGSGCAFFFLLLDFLSACGSFVLYGSDSASSELPEELSELRLSSSSSSSSMTRPLPLLDETGGDALAFFFCVSSAGAAARVEVEAAAECQRRSVMVLRSDYER